MRTHLGDASRCDVGMELIEEWFPSFVFEMIERQAATPLDCSDLYSEQQLRDELIELRRVMREVVGILVLRGIRDQSPEAAKTDAPPLPLPANVAHWLRPETPPKAAEPAWKQERRRQRARQKARKQRRHGVALTPNPNPNPWTLKPTP